MQGESAAQENTLLTTTEVNEHNTHFFVNNITFVN